MRQPVTIRASRDEVRVLHEGQVVAQHVRCYQRGQLIVLPEDRLAALALRRRSRVSALEHQFDALGPEARQFHFHLNSQPVKTSVHLRRLLGLARLYGPTAVLAAISRALELATYDAACVENLLLAERRRRQLPTPTLPTPQRRELIDEIELEPADPAIYDRLYTDTEENSLAVVPSATSGSRSLNAWPARLRHARPRHILCTTSLRALHGVPSNVVARAHLPGHGWPAPVAPLSCS